MHQNRREFLRTATKAGALILAPPELLAATGRGIGGSEGAARVPRQAQSFRGSRPGEERAVEGVRLCWCPPGSFTMGSPPGEVGRRADEAQVPVTLTSGFWIGKTEVTQAEWRRTIGPYPERPPTARFGVGDDFPVYWVNFHEAERFCARLTERAHASAALPTGWAFRLPSEAQWEYACRAGTVTATAFGDELRVDQANFAPAAYGGKRSNSARGSARPAGSYPPNSWGIVDMHGNVWEWCRDWYHARLPGGVDPDLYGEPGVRNGDGTYSRVRRGGAWIEEGWTCRSACRLRYEPPRRSDHIGFRVVAVEVAA